MLRELDDPSKIGVGMATALITTFYGVLLANLIFLPMSGKLDVRSKEETLLKELILEGVVSIQSGDNPSIVEEKLKGFLSPSQRKVKGMEEMKDTIRADEIMEEEPKKDTNEWALAYGDMITLLMTFFVLIIAMSSDKIEEAAETLMTDGTGDNLVVAEHADSGIMASKARSKSKINIDANKLPPPIDDLTLIRDEMVVFMTENELFEVIDLQRTREGFMIRIMTDILFDPGDTYLKVEYLYLLDTVAELLSVVPNSVRIEGHTDDRYIDDNNTGNTLSIARASRVCEYLIEEEMLLSSRFGVAGYGRHRYLYPNNNEHNRAKNRRVEIIIKEMLKDA